MENRSRNKRTVPTAQARNPNISTENQPEGAARQPSDTLDRDPVSAGAISSDYNPEAMTWCGEERDQQTEGKSP